MEKDFNIKVTVRNGRLLSAIRENYDSVAAFARQMGRNPQRVNSLVTMRERPFKTHGWTELALDVAAFLNKDPEELWPEYMREIQLQRSTAELSADLNEVQAIQSSNSPEKQIAQLDAVRELAGALTLRELNVIRGRFVDGMTLDRKMRSRAVSKGFLNTHDIWRTVNRSDGTTFTYHQRSFHTLRDHTHALFADEE